MLRCLIVLFICTLSLPPTVSADDVDVDELLSVSSRIVGDEVTDAELSNAIAAGLWNDQRTALAIAIPGPNRTLLIALVQQASGDFIAADISRIEGALFRTIGLADRTSYERYRTTPDHWRKAGDHGHLLVVRLEAWTE